MKIGVVGHESAKFTRSGKYRVCRAIRALLSADGVTGVVSGHCHLGGVDIWAEKIGEQLGIERDIFAPKDLQWATGYKPRNIQIAETCDACYCFVVSELPATYTGMRFDTCYHCARAGRDGKSHVKSGGCWTVNEAMRRGKDGHIVVISNETIENLTL
jgi:hypothetical protein